ncbi:MAG: hypothetical protein GY774_07055, partial [Planctomycetes bacterium]|nr:hypothetical protein [Planctomycetota bacterium]
MALTIFTVPLLQYIPVAATAPALVYVAYALFPKEKLRELYNRFDWILLVVTGIVVFGWFSLDKAMLIGFSAYFLLSAYKKLIKKDTAA